MLARGTAIVLEHVYCLYEVRCTAQTIWWIQTRTVTLIQWPSIVVALSTRVRVAPTVHGKHFKDQFILRGIAWLSYANGHTSCRRSCWLCKKSPDSISPQAFQRSILYAPQGYDHLPSFFAKGGFEPPVYSYPILSGHDSLSFGKQSLPFQTWLLCGGTFQRAILLWRNGKWILQGLPPPQPYQIATL